MVRMQAEVWVFAEHEEGALKEVTFALLGEGNRICRKLPDGCLSAIVMGPAEQDLAGALGPHGAARVYLFEEEPPESFSPEDEAGLIADLARQASPSLILFAATSLGSDLAPRVAAKLETALCTNCVDIKVGPDRRIEFVKPVSDEMLYVSVQSRVEAPPVATMVPEVMESDEPDRNRKAEVLRIRPPAPARKARQRILGRIKGDPKTIPLEEAEVVVAGGRGLGDEPSFHLIDDLAEAVGGCVGGSRPVVDAGLLPFERQIGRTGRNTSPRLFIACGISGASEFVGGMERSKQVIAINTDKNAPILKTADLGIVGDGRQVIPEIVRLLRERRQQQGSDPEKAGHRKE